MVARRRASGAEIRPPPTGAGLCRGVVGGVGTSNPWNPEQSAWPTRSSTPSDIGKVYPPAVSEAPHEIIFEADECIAAGHRTSTSGMWTEGETVVVHLDRPLLFEGYRVRV